MNASTKRAKNDFKQEKPQMLLHVFWTPGEGPQRGTRFGEVRAHVGDMLEPPLTPEEMQAIGFAAKMEFARVCQRRRGKRVLIGGTGRAKIRAVSALPRVRGVTKKPTARAKLVIVDEVDADCSAQCNRATQMI